MNTVLNPYITIAVTSIWLVACGGGSSSGSDSRNGSSIEPQTDLTGTYQYLGFVEIIQDNLEERVNRDANFLQLTEPQNANVFRNSVPMSVDTCKLSITPTIPTDVGVIGFPEANFTLISAGQTFTLTETAGTYATITLADSRFSVATFPVPTPLTLDIPGAEFPAFSDVAIPDVVTVQNFQPGRNDTLQADTVISWTPTGLTNHTINLTAFDFVDTDKVVDLRCHVADDGNFTLPANIVSALNSGLGDGFAINGLEQEKRTDTLIINGDALLVVSKSLDTL
jgi:hypothetical protein